MPLRQPGAVSQRKALRHVKRIAWHQPQVRRFESGPLLHPKRIFTKEGAAIVDDKQPSYFAIIPSDVRYDQDLPANAKLLYGEISALIGPGGFCFASNEFFATNFKVPKESISRWMSKLEKQGHIKRVIEKDKTGQIVARKIYLRVSVPDGWGINQKINTPLQKNQEGIDENVKDTDTSNTEKKKNKKEKPEPLTEEELRAAVVSGINGLATDSWTPATKNDLYRWVMALYDPNRVVKKAHPVRSKLSVDATFRKLSQYPGPHGMIEALCNAVEGGWQGVQAFKKPDPVPDEHPAQPVDYF